MHKATHKNTQVVLIPDEKAEIFDKAGYHVEKIEPRFAEDGTEVPHQMQELADEIHEHVGKAFGIEKLVAMPLKVAQDPEARHKWHDEFHNNAARVKAVETAEQQAAIEAAAEAAKQAKQGKQAK